MYMPRGEISSSKGIKKKEKQSMEKKVTIREWIINFLMEQYSQEDVKTQIKAGWWDLFCKDSSLRNKTYKMGRIIQRINGLGKVDLDKNYVWFKNNCPLNGPLYDDFRFASIEDGEVQFTVQISCCWNQNRYVVYGRKHKGAEFVKEPLFESDSSKELIEWFNKPWEE